MHPFRWALPAALGLLFSVGCGTTSDPIPTPVPSVEIVSLPGIDTSALTPRERREWSAQMTELTAPCPDVPATLAVCIRESRPCKPCKAAAEMMLKLVQSGVAKKDRDELYRARFDPKSIKTYATDGSPEKGAADPVVTIVEWADFECPACQATFPILEALVERYPTQLKLVYKEYPLKDKHPHAEYAAKAAVAAGAQGKFWEMHHRLFTARGKLEVTDIEDYAKELGLDLAKFKADVGSPATLERMEKDIKQAEGLGIGGTPFILINGREVNDLFFNDPDGWVKLDIELAGKTPQPVPGKGLVLPGLGPAPTGAPTAAPSGEPSAAPSGTPSAAPSGEPSAAPSGTPSAAPSGAPTAAPSGAPTAAPSGAPTAAPSGKPQAPKK